MLQRKYFELFKKISLGYPVIAITGPRQSGKTTLARALFPDKPYINLEDPLERAYFHNDPRGFLNRFPDGAIIDEAQYAPELFSHVQVRVDVDPRMGLYILTGSQQLGLLNNVSQSMSGRVAILELLPFSYSELALANKAPENVNQAILKGGYPPLFVRDVEPWRWHNHYFSTYIQRDVRQILNVQNLDTFSMFVKLCAGNVGQLVNASSLGEACSIDAKTVKHWLSVLQATYVLKLVQPYHSNLKKRLVKSPKLYFFDTGLVCSLLGITEVSHLETHPLRGALFETWVFSELYKARLIRGLRANIFFWRDHTGLEVDFILEQGVHVMPVEVKSGQSVHPAHFKNIRTWCELEKTNAVSPTLVFGGDDRSTWHEVSVIGWREAGNL